MFLTNEAVRRVPSECIRHLGLRRVYTHWLTSWSFHFPPVVNLCTHSTCILSWMMAGSKTRGICNVRDAMGWSMRCTWPCSYVGFSKTFRTFIKTVLLCLPFASPLSQSFYLHCCTVLKPTGIILSSMALPQLQCNGID